METENGDVSVRAENLQSRIETSDPTETPNNTIQSDPQFSRVADVEYDNKAIESNDPLASVSTLSTISNVTNTPLSLFSSRSERRAVIMEALRIVASSNSLLDSFSFERPKSSQSSLFSTNSGQSFDLLASILLAWNRDESISFSGYIASGLERSPHGLPPAPISPRTADEATFRSLLSRQLKGLLGCVPSSGIPIVPSWKKNMRGEYTLSLD
jgi:hypothetical protein